MTKETTSPAMPASTSPTQKVPTSCVMPIALAAQPAPYRIAAARYRKGISQILARYSYFNSFLSI